MKRLLLVIDYQRDFVDGALGFPGAELTVDARCTAGADPKLHREALDMLECLHVTVINR